MGQGYILYLILSVILLAAVFLIWRLSKRRRDVVAPAENEKPSPIPPGEKPAARPELKLVSPATAPAAEAPAPRAEERRSLQEGLAKTRGGFISRLAGLLGSKKIDASLLGQVEEGPPHRGHRRQDVTETVRSRTKPPVARRARRGRCRVGRDP